MSDPEPEPQPKHNPYDNLKLPDDPEERRLKLQANGRKGKGVSRHFKSPEEKVIEEGKKEAAEVRARHEFEEVSEDMAKVIIQAARGHGRFKGLTPREQAQFALKALEYGIGRPRTTKESPEDEAGIAGLTFDVQGAGVNGGVPSTEKETSQ